MAEEDVLKLLKSLEENKATGVDGIGAKLLRLAAPGVSHRFSITVLRVGKFLKSGSRQMLVLFRKVATVKKSMASDR